MICFGFRYSDFEFFSMPLSTKAIKNRIKSVQNTRKITKAMEMVAASKMKKSVDASLASRRYAELALELLMNISSISPGTLRHPLLARGSFSHSTEPVDVPVQGRRVLAVVVASNKGLCGSYNVSMYKQLNAFVRSQQHAAGNVDVITIGKYAERFARKLSLHVMGSFIDYRDRLSAEDIRSVSRLVVDEFTGGAYQSVSLLYTNYVSAISHEVRVQGLLPMTTEHIRGMIERTGGARDHTSVSTMRQEYLFEPHYTTVLDQVLPALLEVTLYQAVLESAASEHSARMVAMKNASDSAKGMVDELTLWYNKARQAAITQEIVEIATGASAVAG